MDENYPLEYGKAIDYVYKKIKNGEYIVGSKLPSERDLAQHIGVGRNSTREAISILRGWGLIESIHGSGNYISNGSDHAIQMIVRMMLALGTTTEKEIIQFRKVISYTVCSFILEKGLSESDRAGFKELLDRMRGAPKEELSEYDKEFHRRLVELTGNTLFKTIMEPIAETYLDIAFGSVDDIDEKMREELVEMHASLIEGLVNKDIEACRSYLTKHYNYVEKKVLGKGDGK